LFLGAAALHCFADSFGRFGYAAGPGLTDLRVSLTGLWANYPNASHLDFAAPATKFAPIHTESTNQLCAVEGGDTVPKKIRTSLLGNSVDLYFPNGVNLVCRSVEAPYLSWTGVSVGANVPTQDVKWILVSFTDAEPPILLGLSGGAASFQVTGSKGAWSLSAPDFAGWLRVWLPFGLDPQLATDEPGLNKLVKAVQDFDEVWESECPSVKTSSVKASDTGIDATWTFTGPGAFVPQAPLLAPLGGSALAITSEFRYLPGAGSDGPRAVVKSNSLALHLPCLKIHPGRALGLGPAAVEPIASVAPSDLPSIVELGNEVLLAWSDDSLIKLADDTVTRFLTESPYVLEPTTQQQLPYGQDAASIVLASAQAYLAQCAMVALSSHQPNALFDSVLWKRDWWTWTIWTGETAGSRRATSIAALAGALSEDPNARFYGATLEAGLDAQRGLEVWKNRKKLPNSLATLDEPLLGLRTGFFFLTRLRETNLDFFRLLQSPLKMGPGPAVELLPAAVQYILQWKSDSTTPTWFSIFGPPDNVSVVALENVDKLESRKEKDGFKLAYQPLTIGTCRVTVALTPASLSIPKEVAPPAF
jgi:hypothetical protein